MNARPEITSAPISVAQDCANRTVIQEARPQLRGDFVQYLAGMFDMADGEQERGYLSEELADLKRFKSERKNLVEQSTIGSVISLVEMALEEAERNDRDPYASMYSKQFSAMED